MTIRGPMLSPGRPTVLTIATPDYQDRWQFCIDSQRLYCNRYGYEHAIIPQPESSLHPKWAKLDIALRLLISETDVLLIDCDAEIAPNCPPFTNVLTTSAAHDFFFVRGISGRVNSGVLILRGGVGSGASALLRDCLAHRLERVPPEDFVSEEGENGHIIHFAKREAHASRGKELGLEWNCSNPARAPDAFIRHYTNRLRAALEAGEFRPPENEDRLDPPKPRPASAGRGRWLFAQGLAKGSGGASGRGTSGAETMAGASRFRVLRSMLRRTWSS